MQLILRILAIFFTVILLVSGLAAMADPARMAAQDAFAMSPDGVAGLGAMRGVIGGHLLGLALIAAYALLKREYRLLYVIAFLEFVTIVGRLASIGIDGFDPRVLGPIVIEAVIATIMFCAAGLLRPRPTSGLS